VALAGDIRGAGLVLRIERVEVLLEDQRMPENRPKQEEIVSNLRQVEVPQRQEMPIADAVGRSGSHRRPIIGGTSFMAGWAALAKTI